MDSRLRNGPVALRLVLQLAGESDPTDDFTALWPADRPLVELGRLEVTRISPTSAADERRLVFDPTNVTDGIGLSADPIPLARSAAYSISYDHRRPNVAKGYRLFRHREGSPGKRFKGGERRFSANLQVEEAAAHVTPIPLLPSELCPPGRRVLANQFQPMKELVQVLAQRLVNHPEAVEVMEMRTDTVIIVELRVAKEDRVIGKGNTLSPSAQSCTRSEVGPTIGFFSRSSRLDESSYRRERKITGETRALVSFAGFLAVPRPFSIR